MKIKTIILLGATATFLAACSTTREPPLPEHPPLLATDHDHWLANCLKEINTIKVGSTRADLLKVFTYVGGFAIRTEDSFVYRGSNYIMVEVKFKPVKNLNDMSDLNPSDEITEISRPVFEIAPND